MAQQFQSQILSVTASGNSAAIDASNMYSISVQVVSSGTIAGAVKIQASNDSPIGNKGFSSSTWTPTNWTDITSATASVTAGSSALIPKLDVCYQFVRIVFTASGGTGTATVQVKALSI